MTAPVLWELVDGRLLQPESRELIRVQSPSDGRLLAWAPIADANRVDQAVECARLAFGKRGWGRTTPSVRAAYLLELADQLEANADAFARAETADTGMTLKMTRQGHVPRAIAHLRYFAAKCADIAGHSVAMGDAYVHLIEREPLGVVCIMVPWNAPLAVATINLAAALAMGNTVILKSSERAPLSLSMLAEVICELEFPPGVVNVLHGPGDPTGVALSRSGRIDGLCFVGSTETARQLVRQSENPFRRHTFELGGKSPTVVCQDANLSEAVDGALLSVFSSNGEVCTAGSRVLVHRKVYQEFISDFAERSRRIRVGDPLDPETEMGPQIDWLHVDSIQAHLRTAIQEGARVVCGGSLLSQRQGGSYISPAVVENVTPSMQIFRKEIFGPVAAFTPFDDVEEAIELANDTEYGLAATVWCGDGGAGLAIARALRCGVVGVNSPVIRDLRVPFGGRGASGLGRVGGSWSLEQFSEPKSTCLRIAGLPLPRYGIHLQS